MPFDPNAIVKIKVSAVTPDYLFPANSYFHDILGTGFIIDQWIVTSAHIINHGVDFFVKIQGKLVPVQVVICAYDCDLALLKCKDPDALKNIKGLNLCNEKMMLGAEVECWGFPNGKDTLTYIKSSISQIDCTSEFNLPPLLTLKLNFELKHGGSGGPVLYKDCVIGVAYKYEGGFTHVVPLPFIKRLLDEVSIRRSYSGIPDLGITWQSTDSDPNVSGPNQGVHIVRVDPLSPTKEYLEPNDFLLSINGMTVRNDGKISHHAASVEISLNHAIHEQFLGASVQLTRVRNNKTKTISVPLKKRVGENLLCPYKFSNKQPDYFFWDGLLILPLTANVIYALQKQNIIAFDEFLPAKQILPRQQLVVLRKFFGSPTLNNFEYCIIDSINDQSIRNFSAAMHALQQSKKEHIIRIRNQPLPLHVPCLSLEENAALRKKHRIPEAYPAHLSPMWPYQHKQEQQKPNEAKTTPAPLKVMGEPFLLFSQSSGDSGVSSPGFGKLSPAQEEHRLPPNIPALTIL